MALLPESMIVSVLTTVRDHWRRTSDALGPAGAGDLQSPLAQHLRLLLRVGNGEIVRSDAAVARVENALRAVTAVLFENAAGARSPIPAGFWDTDAGILLLRARWWVSGDELITISNAAALAFGENTQATRMRIVRAADSGALDWVPDPSTMNPQHNRRVLRGQVERLARADGM